MTGGGRAYRQAWTYVWSAVAGVGSVLALATFRWPDAINIACISAALACGAYCSSSKRVHARQHRRLAMTVAVGLLGGVALVGWISTIGLAAVALAVIAVLTSPGVFGGLYRRLLHKQRRRPIGVDSPPALTSQADPVDADRQLDQVEVPSALSSPPGADTPEGPVNGLSDEQLCLAWVASFITLERLLVEGDTAQQAEVVSRRQQYLDELARRNPQGLDKWLTSGARPAGDPSPYILPGTRRPSQD